ncbi:MAG: carboxypeptidase-like regulatory domain-containing protein, partial [Bacteroidales bacterium]
MKHELCIKRMFITLTLIFVGLSMYAQQTITGRVQDVTGEAIIGANVLEKGTTNGIVTDIDGNFSLYTTKKNTTIVVSFIGYVTAEVSVGNKKNIRVVLQENSQLLDDIVVVGYGTQKKISVTGSISQVNTKELNEVPMDNVSNMLAGRLPGLVTKQSSGIPGEGSSILIRGYATTGTNSPIYIIDGVQRDILGSLDPSEIETITVLKDAASAAVYGVQGASGV